MGGNSAAGKELGNQHPDRQRLSITAADTNRSTLPPPVTKHAPRLQKSFWSAGMTSACREEGYFLIVRREGGLGGWSSTPTSFSCLVDAEASHMEAV